MTVRHKHPINSKSKLQLAAAYYIEKHGGVRKAATELGCDAGYLSRLRAGTKIRPNDRILEEMGLRVEVRYYWINGSTKPGE